MRTSFPKHYFILDLYKERRRKSYLRNMILCDFMSRIMLANGFVNWKHYIDWQANDRFQSKMKDFWVFNVIPPSPKELHAIGTKHIKWYISKHVTVQDKIWNGSFLHGLAQSGKIMYSSKTFNGLKTHLRKRIRYIIGVCPFVGRISDKGEKDGLEWFNVPALSLPHDPKSNSFMAGVFSMGQEYRHKDGLVYARYSHKCKKWFEKWGIPIEGYTPNKLNCLISPFWPSLLHEWMPPILRTWRRIPHAAQASKYAAILWKVYCDEQFVRGGIPYLLNRDAYGTMFSSEDKTLSQSIRGMWVECNLTMLDDRLKELIRNKNFV